MSIWCCISESFVVARIYSLTFHSSDAIYQLDSENSQTGYIGQSINSLDIRTKIKSHSRIENIEINITLDRGMDNNKIK